ncbi:MAG TPA: serine hydrolase domain-containing protein [Thermoanaerobaculia bacterium]|jgi:CubicO group peptidase (beta-lactamase class C family)|nr:serine hydrolase domain-containing protein [Thermoanaerobaculia bacterium]
MHSIFSVLLTLATASASPQIAPADAKAKVDAVFREYDRSDSPGCALGVYRDGKVAYERGFGMANLELGVANSPQTVFDIGSTSKQFTAFAIHLLARDGKLTLDDDIRKWLPELPDYGKRVTIRNLLHHTGGLRDYIELMELQGVRTEDLTTDADSLAILARQKAPNFAPGDEHLYSNTGYFLLSVVVKRASGQSLRDFAAARIFGPLGMRHTQFNDSHTRIIPNRATGYAKADGGGFGIEMGDWEQTGDGGVQTTVEDLQLWDQNFYEPRVGDRKLIEAMQVVGVLNSGKKLQYASALFLEDYKGLPTVSHGGAWVGYRAQLLRFPRQKFSVACLCNLAEANPTRLAHEVAEVYLAAWMTPEAPKPQPKKSSAARVNVPAAQLQSLAGAYRDPESGHLLTLALRDGKLSGQLGRQAVTLVPTAPGRFRIDGVRGATSEVEVQSAERGARPTLVVTTVDEDDRIENATFEPVALWTPTAADLAAFAGTYASTELDTSWTLAALDGKLFVRHRGLPEDPLNPTVSGVFTLHGMSLTFARGADGKVSGFTLDEGRVRGIAFARQPAG